MALRQGRSTVIAALVVVFAHRYALQGASACFHQETAYVGNDLNSGVVEAESAEKCQDACQKDANCAHWTFGVGDCHCHLKGTGAQSRAVHSPLAVSGPRYCALPSHCITDGVEFSSSSDVERIDDGSVETFEACQNLCAEHTDCFFWTYFPTSKECHLKGQGAKSTEQHNAAAISGPKFCPPPATTTCFEANMDYTWEPDGNDTVYHQNVSSAKECQKLCQLDLACRVFTYVETTKVCALGKTMRYSKYMLGATTGPKFCIPPASTGENVEILGKDLATHRTPSFMACQRLCETSPLCSAAAYNTKSETCVHKQTALFDEEMVSGPKICKWLGPFRQAHREQQSRPTASAQPVDNPTEIGVDAAPSAAIEVRMDRPPFVTEGESLCTLHGSRRHYTYRRQQDMYSLHEVSAELQQHQSARLPIRQAHNADEGCFHRGVQILGRDVGTAVAEGPAECQRMCRENELCSVFAYNTSSKLCIQRQRARWAPTWVSFEKQEKRRDRALVDPLSQEGDDTLAVLPGENDCFSSGFHYGEAVLISTTKAESAEACQILCQKVPTCSFFTYSRKEQLCDLLQSGGRKVPKEDSVCGPKFCGVEALTKVAGEDRAHCFVVGHVCVGRSLKHMHGVSSAEDCQRFCQKKPRCTTFSYFPKKQLCRLHVGSSDLVEDPDAVAGPRACTAVPERTVDGKAHFRGGKARSSTTQENVTSAETCREVCAAKPSCDVFTYFPREQRCLLHSGHRIVEAEESWTAGCSRGGSSAEALHSEFPAYAYRTGVASAQECRKLCETDPFCKYSTFYENGNVRRRPQGENMPDADPITQPQFIGRQLRKHVGSCLLTGTCSPEDVPPVAFKDHVASAQECEHLCQQNPLCSVFTFASVQQTCKMHPEDKYPQNDAAPAPRTPGGLLTGTGQGDCFTYGFFYDAPALSFRMKVKYAKECQWLCSVEPLCNFFSYFVREQMCGLLQEQGHQVEEADAVCGPRFCPRDHGKPDEVSGEVNAV